MKTNHGIRPRAGQAWVCRDGRTFEPDVLTGADVGGFTAAQVIFGASDGSLTGSANLTWNGSTFAVTGAATVSTTLGVSGIASFTSSTTSSSTSTGAVVVTGGVGIGGAVFIGGTLGVTGTSTFAAINATSIGATTAGTGKFTTLTDTGLTSGRITFASTGGLLADAAGMTWDGASLNLLTADATIGFRVEGATGRLRIRGYVDATSGCIMESTNTAEGAYLPLTFGGSAYRFLTGAVTSILDSTASSSTTTGALVVTGGVGVGGTLYVGDTLTVSKSQVGAYTHLDVVNAAAGGFAQFNLSAGGSVFGFNWAPTLFAKLACPTTDPIVFELNSAEVARVDTTGVNLASGKVLRVNSVQVVGARVTGYTAMTGSPDKATAYATSTVTLAQLAGRVAQLQADLTTHGLIGA